MPVTPQPEGGAIALAERIFGLLAQGRVTATYKYAVLLGLIDLCLEKTNNQGLAPESVTTRELAQKVVELYWPQVLPCHLAQESVLVQNTGGRQAELVGSIATFRSAFPQDPLLPLWRAREADPVRYGRLVDEAEWKLIEMPLPRLQVVGREVHRFLYEISWGDNIRATQVRAYQRREPGSVFDNRILLKPSVGTYLVQLNGLLRPLLYRQWAEEVARMNRLDAYRLEEFLFRAEREATAPIRAPLLELQGRRCFYCQHRIQGQPVVDHFIPWSRYPDNNLANLVVAHAACNGTKRDFLPATAHVEQWGGRIAESSGRRSDLAAIASTARWPWRPEASLGVARSVYLRLPPDAALWVEGDRFEGPEFGRLGPALGG